MWDDKKGEKQAFRGFCDEAIPHIVALTNLLKGFTDAGDLSLYMDTAGYVRLRTSETEWRLRRRNQDAEFEIVLEMREQLT